MNRALVWKEWRQQRSLVFTAIAAALLMPLFAFVGSFGGFRLDSLTQVLLALQMIVIVPVFAAATGALSFADDRVDNTMSFLLSRPASRARVWGVKVGVAFAAFLAIVLLTLGVTMALSALIGGPTIAELVPSRPYPPGMSPLGGGGTRGFVVNAMSQATGLDLFVSFLAFNATGPSFLLMLFGASVFWSTRSKRPLNAMFAGMLTAATLEIVRVGYVALQMQLTGRARIYAFTPLFICAALLIASFLTFHAHEPATR